MDIRINLNEKQLKAYSLLTDYDNGITEVLYGGGARGGKSFLGCLWQILNRLSMPGSVGFIARREFSRLTDTTMKTFFEVLGDLGLSNYGYYRTAPSAGLPGQSYFFPNGSMIYFRYIDWDPQDPNYDRFGSYGLTDMFLDEAQEIDQQAINVLRGRFSLLRGRRADGTEWITIPKSMYSCNPRRNWIYNDFVKPEREGTLAKYRAFIKALPKDNPYLEPSYLENLMRSDKVTVQRLVYGNFEYDDDPAALFDFDALRDLFHNEHIEEVGGKSCSADLAMKGHDHFVAGSWTGNVCRIKIDKDYSTGREIESDLKNLMIRDAIPRSLTIVDADGMGAYLESYLEGIKEFHGGNPPSDRRYQNLRAECYFKLAELVNGRKLRVICTDQQKDAIIDELSALKQAHIDNDVGRLDVIKKDEWKKLLGGKSPDYSDMLMMAMYWRRAKVTGGAQVTVQRRNTE